MSSSRCGFHQCAQNDSSEAARFWKLSPTIVDCLNLCHTETCLHSNERCQSFGVRLKWMPLHTARMNEAPNTRQHCSRQSWSRDVCEGAIRHLLRVIVLCFFESHWRQDGLRSFRCNLPACLSVWHASYMKSMDCASIRFWMGGVDSCFGRAFRCSLHLQPPSESRVQDSVGASPVILAVQHAQKGVAWAALRSYEWPVGGFSTSDLRTDLLEHQSTLYRGWVGLGLFRDGPFFLLYVLERKVSPRPFCCSWPCASIRSSLRQRTARLAEIWGWSRSLTTRKSVPLQLIRSHCTLRLSLMATQVCHSKDPQDARILKTPNLNACVAFQEWAFGTHGTPITCLL